MWLSGIVEHFFSGAHLSANQALVGLDSSASSLRVVHFSPMHARHEQKAGKGGKIRPPPLDPDAIGADIAAVSSPPVSAETLWGLDDFCRVGQEDADRIVGKGTYIRVCLSPARYTRADGVDWGECVRAVTDEWLVIEVCGCPTSSLVSISLFIVSLH